MTVGGGSRLARCAVVCVATLGVLGPATVRADERAASPVPAHALAGPPAPMPRAAIARPPDGDVAGWRGDAVLVSTGQLADIVSTEIALSRPGAQEANPLLTNRAVRISTKLAIAGGISVGCYELRKHGRPGTARALAVASFVVGAAAAVHNVTVAR